MRLEQRCEVASADAASHLRDLVELEEEGRGFDAAHAALLAKSEEQARQLQESETALLKATGQLEDLRRRERHHRGGAEQRHCLPQAALASSAVPGLFPPVALTQLGPNRSERPYVNGEKWIDGSFGADLPTGRVSRLHNVNHFIVSQTNPHVLPFVQHHGQRGVRASVAGFTAAAARAQGAFTVDLARRITRPSTGLAGQLTERAHALVSQEYRGDIDIHPKVDLRLLRKVVSNPSREDLTMFIAQGERATWPKLTMIRDQTRLGRLLRELVRTETSRVRGDGGT